MLIEISSDKFISNGKVREKIVLTKGLNIVIGDGDRSNSIGKSTFLMIIDFCFGGRDYVSKGEDIIYNVGHHVINYAFKFGKSKYYFSRNTKNLYDINKCDENYETIGKLTIKEFTDFLKDKYISKNDLSFRDIVSKYFRVYGRNVTKVKKPLNVADESEEKAINRLLKLYQCNFKNLEENLNLEKKKKESFESLIKTGVQDKVGKREYDANEKSIQRIKTELLDVTNNFIGTDEAEEIANLKSEVIKLRRQKTKVESEKKVVVDNETSLVFDQEAIKAFFPDIKIKAISDIEKFHSKITKILEEEIQEELEQKQSIIEIIDNQIKEIESKLSEYSKLGNISKKQLAFIQESQRELDELENQNKNYRLGVSLKEKSTEARDNLNNEIEKNIIEISDSLNNQMKLYNNKIFQNNKKVSPKISVIKNKQKKWNYSFGTEGDTGTGTANKALILFDLSILKQTELPAIIHDSFLFTDIANSTVSELLKLYNSFEKQVFISLTDKESYSASEEIIEKNKVLSLSIGGNELFGRSWNEE